MSLSGFISLGEISDSIMGQAPPGEECNKDGVGTPFVKAGEFDIQKPVIREWTTKPQKFAKSTDVLLCVVGATCGKINLGIDCAIGRSVAAIRPDGKKLDQMFLYYFLLSWTARLRAMSQGAAQTVINKEMIANLQIPNLSLAEQKRIAAILDKADAIRRKRQQAIKLADDFLRSVFLEMFGDPVTNPKGWEVRSLGSLIVSGPTNGLYKPSTDYGDGTRILRIDGFYNGFLSSQSKLKRLRLDATELERFRLNERSIVINRVNSREYLGKSAYIVGLEEPTVFESNMMNFSVDENQLNPRYLVELLQTTFIKNQILTSAKDAVNQSSINQQDVKKLAILIPPIELQLKFEAVAERKKHTSFAVDASLTESDKLFLSLSQKVFSGEI